MMAGRIPITPFVDIELLQNYSTGDEINGLTLLYVMTKDVESDFECFSPKEDNKILK